MLKEKLVPALLETLISSGEIKVLEIHVVTLKSDVTIYVICITTKKQRYAVLKERVGLVHQF